MTLTFHLDVNVATMTVNVCTKFKTVYVRYKPGWDRLTNEE